MYIGGGQGMSSDISITAIDLRALECGRPKVRVYLSLLPNVAYRVQSSL